METKVRKRFLFLLAACFLPTATTAQIPSSVDDTTMLQVWHDCDTSFPTQNRYRWHCRDQGTLASSTADSLVLNLNGEESQVAIPWSSVLGVNRKTGRKIDSSRAIGFPLAGAAVGGLAGTLIGYSTCAPCDYELEGLAAAVGAVVGIGVGFIGGLVTGLAWTTDIWEPVSTDRLRLSFSPGANGRTYLGLNISF